MTISPVRDSNKWKMSPPYSATFTVNEIDECNLVTGAGCTTWEYVLTYGDATRTDPGPPFDAYRLADRKPKSTGWDKVGTWTEEAPADVIGQGKNDVNWGLIAFSNTAVDTCANYNGTDSNLLVTAINPSGTDLTGIQAAMRLGRDGGIEVGGGTPTRSALEKAQQHLLDTFSIDPLYLCLRTYGVILVTDGESNACNTGPAPGKEWGFGTNPPCPGDDPATERWKEFPPGISNDIWNLNMTTPCVGKTPRATPINPRTWVIGFGSEVGKCELNFTAFKGRSDAAAPDAGYDYRADPRLSTCTAYDLPVGNPDRKCIAWVDAPYDTSKDYAYFADNTETLVTAFKAITAGAAKGDFATGAPVTGPVSGNVIGVGKYVFLSSTQYPEWAGHLYKFDSSKFDPGGNHGAGYRVWDAGAILKARTTPRRIYTWDPSDLHLIEVNAGALGTLSVIEPTVTAEVVDFILGNDGAGVARASRLGPLINTVPSIVAAPVLYGQAQIDNNHPAFEKAYEKRRIMIWIGSNDGMLHAFDFETGDEILALVPPKLLEAQVRLYQNFKTAGSKGTGQPVGFENIYGVAGSLRFGDVFFPGIPTGSWRTVGFMTLAEGGDLVAAIDITHPYPGIDPTDPTVEPGPDKDYGVFPPRPGEPAKAPVQIIWQKTGAGTDLPGLDATWSLPALAPRHLEQMVDQLRLRLRPRQRLRRREEAARLPARPGGRQQDRDGRLLRARSGRWAGCPLGRKPGVCRRSPFPARRVRLRVRQHRGPGAPGRPERPDLVPGHQRPHGLQGAQGWHRRQRRRGAVPADLLPACRRGLRHAGYGRLQRLLVRVGVLLRERATGSTVRERAARGTPTGPSTSSRASILRLPTSSTGMTRPPSIPTRSSGSRSRTSFVRRAALPRLSPGGSAPR